MITKRLLSIQFALLAGFSSVLLLPHTTNSSPVGIAMTLPRVVGEWIGDDTAVTTREREVLAKDTQFARKLYYNLAGDQIYVSIVLSGQDMTNSIHRPERCLPAQGWSLQGSDKRVLAISNGKSLETTRLRNVRVVNQKNGTGGALGNISYYWFVGYSDITASHFRRTGIDLRDRILHGYNQRWAYVTVAAIVTQGWAQPERTEEQTSVLLEKFVKELVPELKRPDGSALL